MPKKTPAEIAQTESSLVINAIFTLTEPYHDAIQLHIAEHQCYLRRATLTTFGEYKSFNASCSGPWHAIAKLETQLKNLAKKNSERLTLSLKRTFFDASPQHFLPYSIVISGAHHHHLLPTLLNFFYKQGVRIEEYQLERYIAPYTTQAAIQINFLILLPVEHSLVEFRENFMLFCEELNVDALLEPQK